MADYGLGMASPVASGAGAVAHFLDTVNTLAAGKILSLRNNTAEALSLDYAGNLVVSRTGSFGSNVAVGGNALASTLYLALNAAAGYGRQLVWQTGGSARWVLQANTTGESGSNVGSDLVLSAYSDAGASLGVALAITRSTRAATLYGAISCLSTLTVTGATSLSDSVTIGGGAVAATRSLSINTAAGQYRALYFQTAGLNRWIFTVSTDPETGSNAGANFLVMARSDDGTPVGTVLSITRATLLAAFGGGLTTVGSITVGSAATVSTGVVIGGSTVATTMLLNLNTAAGQHRQIAFQSGGLSRWVFRTNNAAESGSNAGSNLELIAYTDAGAQLGTVLSVTRSTLLAAFGGNVSTVGGVTVGTTLTVTGATTLSDSVIVGGSAVEATRSLVIATAASRSRRISFLTGGSTRWLWEVSGTESGSDAGANLAIRPYSDAGANLGTALSITRATMAATFGGALTVTGNLTVNGTGPHAIGVTVQDYVQWRQAGTFTSGGGSTRAAAFGLHTDLVGAAGDTLSLALFEIGGSYGASIVTQTAAEVLAIAATMILSEPAITSNVSSITTAATLYITSAPTEGGTNAAIFVASGATMLPAGTTAFAPLRIAHGVAPTSPVNGDIWTTTSGVFAHINGTTYQMGTT